MIKSIVTTVIALTVVCSSSLKANEINVLTEEWAPFNYIADDKVVGMSTELVEAVLARAGLEYNLKIYPWKRAYKIALETANTFLYTTSRTAQREELFKWVGPLYPRQIILYKLKSREDIIVGDLEDLKNYKLGVLLGGSVEEYLLAHGFESNTHYEAVPKEAQNITKLFAQRVDLIPGSEVSMAFRLKNSPHSYDDLEKAFVLIDQGGYYLAVNIDTSDEVVDLLQNELEVLIKEGMRNRITQKYLGYSFGD